MIARQGEEPNRRADERNLEPVQQPSERRLSGPDDVTLPFAELPEIYGEDAVFHHGAGGQRAQEDFAQIAALQLAALEDFDANEAFVISRQRLRHVPRMDEQLSCGIRQLGARLEGESRGRQTAVVAQEIPEHFRHTIGQDWMVSGHDKTARAR